ncbi:MAG: D-tyrosyl-tRNA(Tyr) deacylase [Anaerolineaceae bacterium 4572_78]|nr:MAG: D-tyrosyl-tRNA(Tyr) deacylase [Anaerolineaceae bacterium 4572_78]
MRAILQRVIHGSVTVNNKIVGEIREGFVILIGVTHDDTSKEVKKLAEKVVHLRVFRDENNKMNRSALDVGAGMLVIPQFTLFADCRKGRRPSYQGAAPPPIAKPLVEEFNEKLHQLGISNVETGIFGAMMMVEIQNDGPVTIILDTNNF